MRFLILAVGRVKEREVRVLLDDYLNRIRRHANCDEVELKDDSRLEKSIPASAFTVALEVDGVQLSSEQLAEHVERWVRTDKGVVAFVIGGADGLPAPILHRADFRLSLSRMTLPHRLARLVLAEQLYRSMSILRGEPYPR